MVAEIKEQTGELNRALVLERTRTMELEIALRRIAAIDWPVNFHGDSPQKIAAEALRLCDPPRQ